MIRSGAGSGWHKLQSHLWKLQRDLIWSYKMTCRWLFLSDTPSHKLQTLSSNYNPTELTLMMSTAPRTTKGHITMNLFSHHILSSWMLHLHTTITSEHWDVTVDIEGGNIIKIDWGSCWNKSSRNEKQEKWHLLLTSCNCIVDGVGWGCVFMVDQNISGCWDITVGVERKNFKLKITRRLLQKTYAKHVESHFLLVSPAGYRWSHEVTKCGRTRLWWGDAISLFMSKKWSFQLKDLFVSWCVKHFKRIGNGDSLTSCWHPMLTKLLMWGGVHDSSRLHLTMVSLTQRPTKCHVICTIICYVNLPLNNFSMEGSQFFHMNMITSNNSTKLIAVTKTHMNESSSLPEIYVYPSNYSQLLNCAWMPQKSHNIIHNWEHIKISAQHKLNIYMSLM